MILLTYGIDHVTRRVQAEIGLKCYLADLEQCLECHYSEPLQVLLTHPRVIYRFQRTCASAQQD